jgi:hypothetical protein
VSSIQSFQILSPQIHTLVAPSAYLRESFNACENRAAFKKNGAKQKWQKKWHQFFSKMLNNKATEVRVHSRVNIIK